MADTENTPAENTTTDAPADAVTDKATDAPNPDVTPDESKDDTLKEGGVKALEAERKAAREAKAELKKLQAKLKSFEDEKLSQTEKLQRDHDDFKAKYETLAREVQQARAEKALTSEIRESGVTGENAELIEDLVASGKYGTLEVDEDGETNAAEILKALKKRRPALFEQPAVRGEAGAGKGSPARNGRAQMGSWLRNA